MSLHFAAPSYRGGRHLLKCGSVSVGAVFPPVRGTEWQWRCFLTELGQTAQGTAKSELAAKNELLARFRDFLRSAELEPTP